jgi:U3 small nucleolar RNA-associated protein 20
LSALRILSAARPAAEGSTSAGTIWAHCLQVEQSEMTLRNVRERTTNIARLSRLLLALPDDLEEDVEGVVRHVIGYLLSQLKVSFRPLWAEIVQALSSLAQRHAATVAQIPDFGVEKPDWASITPSQQKSEDEEEDPEFKCPNLDKSRRVLTTSWSSVKDEQQLDRAEIEVSGARFQYEC